MGRGLPGRSRAVSSARGGSGEALVMDPLRGPSLVPATLGEVRAAVAFA